MNVSSSLPQIAFIVGMGRSGTTLLTNMLNSNAEVIASPENEFIIHSFREFEHKDFSDPAVVDAFIAMFERNFNRVISIWKPRAELRKDIAALDDKCFANVCKMVYLNYPLSEKDKTKVKWVIDKNPFYSLHIDTLHRLFPDAKFIVIARDYRDNIISRKKYSDETVPLHKLAAHWNYFYEEIFHSLKKNNLPHHFIRYEDLASDPVNALKAVCRYLNIEYSDQMLQFQELSKKQKQHAAENVSREKNEKIQRMHSNLEKAVNTERVNAFVNELDPSEIALLDYACADLAGRFGYRKFDQAVRVSFANRISYRFSRFKTGIFRIWNRIRYRLPASFRPSPPAKRI
jgi:hypothetical protein